MTLEPSAQRVQDELRRRGSPAVVRQLERSTRSAADAAQAVGCEIGQIAKSLVFQGARSHSAILVITSGANRVDEAAVGARIGEGLKRAGADFVRDQTGFAIGGIPPLGHSASLTTYFDEDLLNYASIWAAAGTPNAVFEIDPHELLRLCRAKTISVRG